MVRHLLLVFLLGMGLGCGPGRGGSEGGRAGRDRGEILVSVASSMRDVVEELARRFERTEGVTVRVNVGASSGLASQILAGAPVDLYLSASSEWADVLEKEGLVLERVALATNRLVVVAPRGNPAGIGRLQDLMLPSVRRVALAGERVPAGVYADQALRSAGIWEPLVAAGKLVRGQDVRITLSFVERGEAEAGLVYATDARLSNEVEVVSEVDPSGHEAIVYPLVLIKSNREPKAARRFFEYLQSDDARAVFTQFGFAMLASS